MRLPNPKHTFLGFLLAGTTLVATPEEAAAQNRKLLQPFAKNPAMPLQDKTIRIDNRDVRVAKELLSNTLDIVTGRVVPDGYRLDYKSKAGGAASIIANDVDGDGVDLKDVTTASVRPQNASDLSTRIGLNLDKGVVEGGLYHNTPFMADDSEIVNKAVREFDAGFYGNAQNMTASPAAPRKTGAPLPVSWPDGQKMTVPPEMQPAGYRYDGSNNDVNGRTLRFENADKASITYYVRDDQASDVLTYQKLDEIRQFKLVSSGTQETGQTTVIHMENGRPTGAQMVRGGQIFKVDANQKFTELRGLIEGQPQLGQPVKAPQPKTP